MGVSPVYNSHDRPDGNSYITAIEETDLPEWRAAAENIAYGMNSMTTVKEAFDAWMDSPPHRENILNPDVRYMACAKATKKTGNTLIGNSFFTAIYKKILDRLLSLSNFFVPCGTFYSACFSDGIFIIYSI